MQWIQRFYPHITDDSQVAWCSIFLMVLFQEHGLNVKGISPAAKSWAKLKNAAAVDLTDSQKDDIAIFHRDNANSWKGHVGIIGGLNIEGDLILLSGNHNNRVTVEAWKTDKLWKVMRPDYFLIS